MKFDYRTVPHFWVNRLGFVIRKELSHLFRAAGQAISPEEWAVLLLLWESDMQTPSELADKTIRDRTTMTRLLDAMEAKELLVRRPDPEDRRKSCVCLTEAGHAKKKVLIPLVRQLIEKSTTGIPDEDIAITVRTLARMTFLTLEDGT